MYLVCYKGNNIFDRLTRVFTEKDITHVGLALEEPVNDNITYLALRYANDCSSYTEPVSDVELYPIRLRTKEQVEAKYSKIKPIYSLQGDIGYRPEFGRMSSYEYVARLLDLGCPERYKLEDLIRFTQL